jgi:subtilisin family serine protease
MLRSGTNTAAAVAKASKQDGVKADRSFTRAFRGYSAKLDREQRAAVLADPNVLAVVPDEVVTVAQTTPTGVSRIGGLLNPIARIDGVDQRVDADVAIVDTGIALHPDLNVAGGHNCSSADPNAWSDDNHHGTHVAGTVGALDNGFGVVGVAPGVRLWAVKILNANGSGLLSWYVCGLDWILNQHDAADPTRPLIEAVNMSVTKAGTDDHNCGLTNHDPLHLEICRVVAAGITVVAAAANDHHNAARNIPASYDEVITVSALADTDGRSGGLGGNACFSWGGYDKDDTFADFSNYGTDVDIMAPGKCIISTVPGPSYATISGTSMAAPAVTGAAALYKSTRPNATPAQVREGLRYLGNYNWKVATDPDPYHEPLLDVSRLGALGTFTLTPGAAPLNVEGGGAVTIPFSIVRSATFFERVLFSVTSMPAGWTIVRGTNNLFGWSSNAGALSVIIPRNALPGAYQIGLQGTNQGRTQTTNLAVNVVQDSPTAQAPVTSPIAGVTMGASALAVRVSWRAATDPTSGIGAYQVQARIGAGAWGATVARTGTQLSAVYSLAYATSYGFRVRAMDTAGNWSPWVESVSPTRVQPVDDRSASIGRSGVWLRAPNGTAWRLTETGSRTPGSALSLSFSGWGIAVVGPTNKYRGWARLSIDGTYLGTINMRSARATSRRLVFARYLTPGLHTITLQSMGAGRSGFFGLDAFVVLQ